MTLDTLNPWFNDWFQTRHRKKKGWRNLAYRALSKGIVKALDLRTRLCDGVLVTNQSIVENVTVLRWLKRGPRILDIGCTSTRLPIQLASVGYQVEGLDLRPYLVPHRNFRFTVGDLFEYRPASRFDAIFCLSAIETFGLGGYDPSTERPERDDRAAMRFIRENLLKPDGQLFLSAPYGAWRVQPTLRVYDAAHVKALTEGYRVGNEAYFIQEPDGDWVPAAKDDPRWAPGGPVTPGVFVLELGL